MVILGGPGTLFGPLIGAGAIVFLRNIVSGLTDRWLLILGAVYVLVVLFAPRGIVGEIKDRLDRRSRAAVTR
jgi:branched-chain amino acid transport system permease protein